MIYKVGGLWSGISSMLVLDLFDKFALSRSPYTFRFQLEWGFLNHNEFKFSENELIFVIFFVYNPGAMEDRHVVEDVNITN